jgi:hypothetical protein
MISFMSLPAPGWRVVPRSGQDCRLRPRALLQTLQEPCRAGFAPKTGRNGALADGCSNIGRSWSGDAPPYPAPFARCMTGIPFLADFGQDQTCPT